MSSIDSRIVTMKFDNASFSRGVSSTLDLLAKLKSAVTGLPSSSKNLGEVSAAANKFSTASMQNEIGAVTRSFSVMGAAGIAAIATIANRATLAGIQLTKSLTIAPISEGLSEYETNLNSIQTILANTGLEGQKGLDKVNGALDELNHYSDKTIYNFSEMARNIGTFTAAGVNLEPATEAIKGIANLAAVSGSNSQQASTAMYQLSQALAAGRVSLMDWNSVVNAGMGGEVFQDALKETARVHGVAVDQIVSDAGSFRASISEGWITSDILTETLSKFTGDLSRAQLESMGYTEKQIDGIIKMGKTAVDAATKVKTVSALINTLQETATSGWAQTWQLILGDFGEAKKMFTAANDVLGGMLSESAKRRNAMFREWNKMGGRDVAIEAISNAFQALLNVIRPVRDAFRTVFPPMTGKGLFAITETLRDFTEGLILSKDSMKDVQTIFEAIFGVLGIGVDIVQGIIKYFATFIGLLTGSTGGLLDLVASVAEIVKSFTEWVRAGDKIGDFFDMIIDARAKVLGPVIETFGEWLSVLAGFVSSGADVAIETLVDAFVYLQPILNDIIEGLKEAAGVVQTYLIDAFEKLKPVLVEVKEAIGDAFGSLSGIGGSVGGAFGGLANMFDIGDSADVAAEGIEKVKGSLGSIGGSAAGGAKTGLAAFGEWLKDFGSFLLDVGSKVLDAIIWVGEALYDEFKGLTSSGSDYIGIIKDFLGDIFSNIADALSDISFGEIIIALNTALMGGIGASFTRFLWNFGGVFKDMRQMFQGVGDILDQATSNLKTMQTDIRSNIILKIAVALGILAAALYVLSTIDSEDLGKALGGLTALLIALVGAIVILEKTMPDESSIKGALNLAAISVVIVGLGIAMLTMAAAMKILSTMDADEIKKGLIAFTTILAGIVGATAILNKAGGSKSMVGAAVAIGIMSVSLLALSGALKKYAKMDTDMMVEGGLKIAGLILGLGLAFQAFRAGGAVAGAAAILVASFALKKITNAVEELSKLDSGDSWQAILTLGGALLVLAAGSFAMSYGVAGAAALILVAQGLKMLLPSLHDLADMPWKTLLSTIGKLALVLVVIGTLGIVAGAGLAILGAGLILFGTGLLLAGAGTFLFATGMSVLATVGVAAMAVLIESINMFLEAIPGFMRRLKEGLVETARTIKESGPAFIRAGTAIMISFLKSIRKLTPQFGKTFRVILAEILKTLRLASPDIVRTGIKLLMDLIEGLNRNMEKISRAALDLIIKFIGGLNDGMHRITNAGVRLAVKFINSVAQKLRDLTFDLWEAAKTAAGGIITGLLDGMNAGLQDIKNKAAELAMAIPNKLGDVLKINSPSKVTHELGLGVGEGLADGIDAGANAVRNSADGMARGALDTIKASMNKISDASLKDLDIVPTIAPVLDLTKMSQEANKISSMLDLNPIRPDVSYAQAADLSARHRASVENEASSQKSESPNVTLTQNNYSPKSLSNVEIYRDGKSLIALAKEALRK